MKRAAKIYTALIFVFLFAPIAILLVFSFNDAKSLSVFSGFSLKWYYELFRDAETLNALGTDHRAVASVFLYESRLITLIGAIFGIALGLLLCGLQAHFGWLRLGNGEGNFIVDAYPVSVHWQDVLFVLVTVVIVGFATVWQPVHYLCKKML